MRKSPEESLTLLDSSDDEYDLGRESPKKGRVTAQKRNRYSCFIFCGFMIFIIFDVAAYIYIARVLTKNSMEDSMEFRNPYIGLDELYGLGKIRPSEYGPIINVPRYATQISRSEKNKAFPEDEHRWLSDFGTLSPPDRHLWVSNTLHTIVQFSVLDYGMEKCAIVARLPKRDAVLPHDYMVKDTRGVIHLNVCQLESSRPLEAQAISWSKHPRCVRELGVLAARVGEEIEMEPFSCKSGEFLAFEISCAQDMPNCGVDVWSNQNDTWGIFMRQYQTVE